MIVKQKPLKFRQQRPPLQHKTQDAPQNTPQVGSQENRELNLGLKTKQPSSLLGTSHIRAKVWKPIVLESLRQMPNYTIAARAAGISYQALQQYRQRHSDFDSQCKTACDQGVQLLEAQCWKRASSGWTKPIWQRNAKGDPVQVGEEKLFDGKLAQFLLTAHAPLKYSQKIQQEISGPNGQPLVAAAAPIHCTFVIPDNGRGLYLKDAQVGEDTKQLSPPPEPETK